MHFKAPLLAVLSVNNLQAYHCHLNHLHEYSAKNFTIFTVQPSEQSYSCVI